MDPITELPPDSAPTPEPGDNPNTCMGCNAPIGPASTSAFCDKCNAAADQSISEFRDSEPEPPAPQPTVGRMVHYSHFGSPRAAVISGVNLDGTVELGVFNVAADGCSVAITARDNIKKGSMEEHGTWSWPPRA